MTAAVLVAWWCIRTLPAWATILAIAVTEFFALKFATLRGRPEAGAMRVLGYVCAWPGMEARRFLRRDDERSVASPGVSEIGFALLKLVFGVMLTVWAARHVATAPSVFTGLLGMLGLIFILGSWIFAADLASGTPLARAVCGFLAAFWTLRWIAAALLDVRPYLINGWWRLGYGATNVVFCLLPFVYGWAAARGGR